MAFLIGGANSAADTAFSVDNSCRFNGTDSSLTRTPGSAGNVDKWTLSLWLKRGWQKFASFHTLSQGLFCAGNCGSGDYTMIRFQGSGATYPDAILWENYVSSSLKGQIKTLVGWRDVSAWYNYVFVWDSGNGTAGNRMRIYANGKEVTAFGSDVNPDQNQDSHVCGTVEHNFGNFNSEPFNGYMAEVALCDGQTLAASDFGEFDEDSPNIWKPKDISGLTFGTTGFYLDFADSGDLGDDESGSSNDFAENNIAAVDQATDTPTLNYATFDSGVTNYTPANNASYSEGNCKSVTTNTGGFGGCTTIGVTKGKWYAEFHLAAVSAADDALAGAFKNPEEGFGANSPHDSNKFYGVRANGAKYTASTASNSWAATFAATDIISIALDLDNNRLYAAKNGSWSDGDGNYDESSPDAYVTLSSGDTWFLGVGDAGSGMNVTWEANFGNPPFTISSSNADANDYGSFEFAVPSGYFALNSKNLAEYG
jgi:hypothetical protein